MTFGMSGWFTQTHSDPSARREVPAELLDIDGLERALGSFSAAAAAIRTSLSPLEITAGTGMRDGSGLSTLFPPVERKRASRIL